MRGLGKTRVYSQFDPVIPKPIPANHANRPGNFNAKDEDGPVGGWVYRMVKRHPKRKEHWPCKEKQVSQFS
jgi:hypothetical protein